MGWGAAEERVERAVGWGSGLPAPDKRDRPLEPATPTARALGLFNRSPIAPTPPPLTPPGAAHKGVVPRECLPLPLPRPPPHHFPHGGHRQAHGLWTGEQPSQGVPPPLLCLRRVSTGLQLFLLLLLRLQLLHHPRLLRLPLLRPMRPGHACSPSPTHGWTSRRTSFRSQSRLAYGACPRLRPRPSSAPTASTAPGTKLPSAAPRIKDENLCSASSPPPPPPPPRRYY